MAEFFEQGDKEKAMKLPVSPMCDRATTAIPKTQIGFIDFVVQPLYTAWGRHLPWALEEAMANLGENKRYWQSLEAAEASLKA